ncbi:E3 ubiquitin protein ligase DRIP2-like [Hibiscus syriacus]|uniref:E3 ubiquitin protein ligase DRIP2-like n=1 Tax=Hibiscus syriacus TaxID=106335 RepID=UPI0019236151|nr:E3 ubiquitin protein ligase DRIP2-like [Hibiscus syriacus]
MSDDFVKVQRRPFTEFLTCPLCQNLFREATTICICLHTFCKQCIYRKLEEENRNHCPACNADLGSFPEKMLRHNHNLRKLVSQISPLEKTSEDFGIPTEGDIHSINKKQNELTDLEMPGIYNVISEPTACAFSLGTYETKFDVRVKRRRTMRKPCRLITGKGEDDLKIDTVNEMSKLNATGLGKTVDSTNLKGMALPQIPKPFIHTRNGDLAVCFVNKYLARKLYLEHESEVEVMCFGHPLVPDLTLNDLVEIWLEAISCMKPARVRGKNRDGRNFLMELTYRRSNERCTSS